MQSGKYYKNQARMYKALANEARLIILDALSERERSAGELTELVGLNQSTVSKHLSVLLSAGIVDNRKEGNVVFYRLLTPCIVEAFSCVSTMQKG